MKLGAVFTSILLLTSTSLLMARPVFSAEKILSQNSAVTHIQVPVTLIAQQEQLEQCRQTARRQKPQVSPNSEGYRQWQAEDNRYSELIDGLESTIIHLEDLSEKALPFNDPVYWAPFTCQGLR